MREGCASARARTGWVAMSEEIERLRAQKDAAYSERNHLVALLAALADDRGWRVGTAMHPEADASWDADWRTIVFIDSPCGQLSWHLHDSERRLVSALPAYAGTWDGHTTEQKYQRVRALLGRGEP
jgi:hypothetical protein